MSKSDYIHVAVWMARLFIGAFSVMFIGTTLSMIADCQEEIKGRSLSRSCVAIGLLLLQVFGLALTVTIFILLWQVPQ